jgi:hypothetical protein
MHLTSRRHVCHSAAHFELCEELPQQEGIETKGQAVLLTWPIGHDFHIYHESSGQGCTILMVSALGEVSC